MQHIQDPAVEQLPQQIERLEQLKAHLKFRFFGIDFIIDQAVDSLAGWYLMPELQERPLIINLWGLTGVGKTALVQEIIRYLDYENFSYFFNFGEDEGTRSLFQTLDDFNDTHSGKPLVLVLDEFQSAHTINYNGEESKSEQMLWTLLDSGRAQLKPDYRHVYRVYNAHHSLSELAQRGEVTVRNGKVTQGLQAFYRTCDMAGLQNKNPPFSEAPTADNREGWFLPFQVQHSIARIRRSEFSSSLDVRKTLEKCDAAQSLQLLQRALEQGPEPHKIDASKALVFVLGNLDEAFTMADNFSKEMSADEFREQSLSIGIDEIKAALQHRFRNEQIARLGNIHLIYPALGEEHFCRIINDWIEQKMAQIHSQHRVSIRVGEGLRNFLYREGVNPAQGTRPLFSTLHQHLASKLSAILLPVLSSHPQVSSVQLDYQEERIHAQYFAMETLVYEKLIPLRVMKPTRPIRENPDLRALISVHEAGHAVASIYLNGLYPLKVQNFAHSQNSHGFAQIKYPYELSPRQLLWNKAAVLLAGQQAEMLVFGEDLQMDGAASDLEKATHLLSHAIRRGGLGTFSGSCKPKSLQTSHDLHDHQGQLEEELSTALQHCGEMAQNVLRREKRLLLKMSEALLERGTLVEAELREISHRHGKNEVPVKVAVPDYHEKLRQQLSQCDLATLPQIMNTQIPSS